MNKLCLLLLSSIVLFKANGQPGSLDPTFGNNGIQTTAFFSNLNLLYENKAQVLTNANEDIFVVVQSDDLTRIAKYLPDGRLDSSYGIAGFSSGASLEAYCATMQGDKIIVAGAVNFFGDFALARYTSDGALDYSFGINGKVVTDFNSSQEGANAIAIQGDNILLAGSHNNDFAVVRYTADGSLDSSFGNNGIVTTDFDNFSTEYASSIAIQKDKIILAGSINYSDFALARYTANGTLDSSFGENGKVITDFNGTENEAYSMVLQGDKIIVGGYAGDFGSRGFALARYTTDGRLDFTFGEHGKVTTNINGFSDVITALTLEKDKIIAGGYTYDSVSSNDFALAQYTADGVLESSFGVNGKVTMDVKNNSYDEAKSIALHGNKIILAGTTYYSKDNTTSFVLARYRANGVLDASFGVHGKLIDFLPSAGINHFISTVIQGNKIIAAGNTRNNHNNDDIALARYNPDGTLDASFGVTGKVITDFGGFNEGAYSIALQGDKIVVAGYRVDKNYTKFDFAVVRYTADGSLDSSFGENGLVTTDFGSSNEGATSIAIQGDKIVVAGSTGDFGNYNFAVARYTADGKLDASFGKGGKVITDFNNTRDFANAIAIQGDKIIVAGYAEKYNDEFIDYIADFALVRYTADGKLDVSFGKGGKVITDFNSLDDFANAIALQGDKIVVTGYTFNRKGGWDFALARYTPDGVLDTLFGEKGKAITDLNNSSGDYATSMVLQEDKIILGGYTDKPENGPLDFALTRYTADGRLDSTFGENGKVITDLGGFSYLQDIALYQSSLYAVGSLTVEATGTYGVVAAYQLEALAPTISIADVTVSESRRLAVVTVRISKPTNQIVRVHFTTRDKTAMHNVDYYGISGPLFFIPGVNITAKIIVPIINDNQQEGDEQFNIVLSNAHNATIQDSVGVVTIVDDDNAPIAKRNTSFHIQASPNPSSGVFIIQLQGSNLKQPVIVRIYDVNGRLIEQRNNISIGQSFRLGEQYKPSTYIIEAVQGSQRTQTKVIKTGQ